MKNVVFLLMLGFISCLPPEIKAQDNQPEEFKPHGEPILQVFSNFHASITKDVNQSAIEIRRAYFGYDYQISKEFSINAKLDIGSPDDDSPYSRIRRYAYFKNAALTYRKDKLSVNVGLIGLKQFKLQERFWGYRYIYKSFMDEYDFGASADIGASVDYVLNDFIRVDFTVMNGEGYVQLQADNTYKAGLGITLNPFDGLTARVYVDETNKNVSQNTIGTFLGYRFNDLFSIGAEYNYQSNVNYMADKNLEGLSFYATWYISDQLEVFGRYDRLTSNITSDEERPWNLVNDGTAIISGVQFSPVRQVNVSLNYQDWYPLAKNAQQIAYVYLNLEYKIN